MAISVVDKQNVERTGKVESQRFQIAATAEAFRILSDGLYSDKVTAVIRELSTNAIDAHIEAGNGQRPFQVHLPSDNQPWFKIRDFGTGMEHDKVMSLYSTYFGTDKIDNPNVVGQLGLGSKSPLSYTRSFTVTSYKDGQKNHYVVMLDEDRIPQVNHLPEQSGPTSEPDGVEIQLAVRRSDFTEFCNKAANVYRYFTHRPAVSGNPHYKIADQEVLVQGQGWRIYKGAGTAKAIMGNIAYPIQSDKVHEVTQHQRTILGLNIEIDFQIGALEFTPSRETLSYKKRTSEVLRGRLDEIVNEVNKEVAKRFENCKSLWEARVLANTMFWSANSDLRNLQQLADIGSITYKGQKLQGQQLHFENMQGIEAYSFAANKKYRTRWSTYDSDVVSISVKRSPRKYFVPKSKIMWCEIDLPRGSFARCQDVVHRGEAEEVYAIAFATQEARKEFCQIMGLVGNEFVKTSSLPKPAIQKGVYHRSTAQVYKHTGSTSEYRFYKYWTAAEVELSDGGVYVEMRRNKAFVKDHTIDPREIGEIVEALKKVGHTIEVVGVRPTVAKEFRKSDDWVDVYTYVKNLLRTQIVQNDLGKHLANANEIGNIDNFEAWQQLIAMEANMGLTSNSPMKIFLDKINTLLASKALVQNKNAWNNLAQKGNVSLSGFAEYQMKDTNAEMFKQYPMISLLFPHLDRWTRLGENDIVGIGQYVNLVDQKNGVIAI